ncbi:hypothetical protein JCM9533A_09480 [Catenuloplanes niger JCM 9533]
MTAETPAATTAAATTAIFRFSVRMTMGTHRRLRWINRAPHKRRFFVARRRIQDGTAGKLDRPGLLKGAGAQI